MDEDLTAIKNITGSRMAADERRLQILQVAVQLFSQHGFRGTTTREIATAAGVSEAMVFRHFATKQDLYTAILDYKVCSTNWKNPCDLFGEFIAAKDDFGVFYNLAINLLKNHKQDLNFMRLLLHSALEGHELAEMFFERFIVGLYEFLGSYVEERQKDGVFRDVEPRVVVRAFSGMLIHHSLNNNLWDKEGKLLKISDEKAAQEFTEILLRGIKLENEKV